MECSVNLLQKDDGKVNRSIFSMHNLYMSTNGVAGFGVIAVGYCLGRHVEESVRCGVGGEHNLLGEIFIL
eukprot:15364470-Ditylum_brightwellii.AAC.2